ncbi:MAG: hypothetical protein QOE14_95 [Humisphaera sp.]|nr:hypothetical protein [Humisphaera sp.]
MPRNRNMPRRNVCIALLAMLISCCCFAAPAFAKVKIDVEVGWENKFRAGKWTPLFITLQDDSPRQVVVEIDCPTDRRYALNVQQGLAIGPQPVIVPLYAPLSYRLDETTVTVRDANTGRRLEHLVISDYPAYAGQGGPETVPPANLFIVISGSASGERLLQSQLRHQNIATGFIAPSRLPITPVGYESIDVLLLNQPDLARLSIEQQGAMADWVRGGGMLVIVPGASPAPPIGPLTEIFPARLGEIRQLDIDPAVIKKAGLPARFGKLTGRDLPDAAADARATPLFDPSGPKALRHWVGMGQVMLLPVDVSTLTFDDQNNALAFWRATLKGLAVVPAEIDNNTRNNYGMSDDPRRAVAVRQALDWIGDVPGAGNFGFAYVAVVLIAMMLIVGPVDWFVLKWLGKQPWTWVTITGWIGVVTLGSIYIGHIFKSGEVHFRTASLIDEAGGARVAAIDLAGIYSPRTTEYDLEMSPYGWWRTASLINSYGGSELLTEIPCHQDYRGNRPLPMLINVWNVRFIEGQQIGAEPAMVQAQLTRVPGGRAISGTITNRAAVPMINIMVRTRDGIAKLYGALEPGATMQVAAELVTDRTLAATTQMSDQEQWALYQQNYPTTRPTPQSLNGVSDMRSLRIDEQLGDRDDVACVYAMFESPPSERLKLNGVENPQTAHIGVVRALVTMRPQQ